MAGRLTGTAIQRVRTGNRLTQGERGAERLRNMRALGPFVLAFFGMMGAWVVANSVVSVGGAHEKGGFNPYPYILLDLFLSILAGVQAAPC